MTERFGGIMRHIECTPWLRWLVALVFGVGLGIAGGVYVVEPIKRSLLGTPVHVASVIAPDTRVRPGDSIRVAYTVIQARLCRNRMVRQWYAPDGTPLGRASVVRTGYTTAGQQVVPMVLTVPLDAAGYDEAVHHGVVLSECGDGAHATLTPDVRVRLHPPDPLDGVPAE